MRRYLANHPAFQQLLLQLDENEQNFSNLVTTQISGIPPVLQQPLISLLENKKHRSFVYVSKDDSSLRRLLNTAVILSLKDYKFTELIKLIIQYNFNRAVKVADIGEYNVQGDILSCWPAGYPHPIRISAFDEEIEFAYTYDEIYTRKYHDLNQLLLTDFTKLEDRINQAQIVCGADYKTISNTALIFSGDELMADEYGIQFDFAYAPIFLNNIPLLEKFIKAKAAEGYKLELLTDKTDQIPVELRKYSKKPEVEAGAGFISEALRLIVLTDRELFGTVYLQQEVNRLSSQKARKLLANLEGEIEIGDYVVHEDYGIGIYNGMKQEEYQRKVAVGVGDFVTRTIVDDYLLIRYYGKDELYVPLQQIDKLTKYISPDDREPEISKLDKAEWKRVKDKVKESVFAMAKELVELYAKRELAASPEINVTTTELYENFIANFPYQETEDQLRTEKEIFADLQQSRPMNRLIVGDVGFGKTEVAMRAACKVMENGFQVAVLCPTTVLAAQHESVFQQRFAGAPFHLATLSRLSEFDNKQVKQELASGKLDLVIGTHALLSEKIDFAKLGLLIIDEEQKFGVKQKERLKELSVGVHVLSMSATPIPRTLSMALSAIQDISIIQTPPEGRKAVTTIVDRMDWSQIKEAVIQELQRKGQVYFLHNQVRTIESVAAKLRHILPQANIVVGHGQMPAEKLALTMKEFYRGEHDILVCTTIIENGIDMDNVNTIIITHAQNFGLGQLYQLRGRVGRGNRQAYAYLFYDGEDIDKQHKEDDLAQIPEVELKKMVHRRKYKQRLKAIREAQELGSGFILASKDLEIRGAGNLLGKKQHGNIKYIGYALYMQSLAEEIERLKNGLEISD